MAYFGKADKAPAGSAAGSILPATALASMIGSNPMQGRLIYLTGPSGAGKDSLLDAARAALAERGVRIARLVIPRSADAIDEARSAEHTSELQSLLSISLAVIS